MCIIDFTYSLLTPALLIFFFILFCLFFCSRWSKFLKIDKVEEEILKMSADRMAWFYSIWMTQFLLNQLKLNTFAFSFEFVSKQYNKLKHPKILFRKQNNLWILKEKKHFSKRKIKMHNLNTCGNLIVVSFTCITTLTFTNTSLSKQQWEKVFFFESKGTNNAPNQKQFFKLDDFKMNNFIMYV